MTGASVAGVAKLPRIVILNDSSIAKGGATGLATLSAREFAAKGYETVFITGDSGDDGALKSAGVDLVPLGGQLLLDRGRLKALRTGVFNAAIRDRIAEYITLNDTPETVYHLHGWSRILSPSVFKALQQVASRTFIHAHDFFLACPNGAYYNFQQKEVCKLEPLSTKCLMTRCDRRSHPQKIFRSLRSGMLRKTFDMTLPWAGVLALDAKMTEPLHRAGIPKELIRTLKNPATRFSEDRIEAEIGDTFCFIGRVERGKGIAALCEAARIENVSLRVIGEGASRVGLQKRYPEVEFMGWVDKKSISQHLTGARAVVMPSHTPEPFGLVAAEATLSGLPIILSRQALLSEAVEIFGLGFVVVSTSPEDIADVLRKVATLPTDELRAMSERGFNAEVSLSVRPVDWLDHLLTLYLGAIQEARV